MSTTATGMPRNLARSTGAVLLSFLAVVLLSLGTDQVLHSLDVYPPWGEPMHEPGLNLLALSYRVVYAILGSAIAARLAPRNPMRHAMVVGIVGLVMSGIGAIVTTTMADLGPDWYPIALVVTALPCAWIGGVLHRSWQAPR